MDNKLIILAIHSSGKANILKDILELNGISVTLEKVKDTNPEVLLSDGYYIKVNDSDLTKALAVVEENRLFSYNDKNTYKIDDGRKRILVAVDFSSYSLKACQIAFSIAKESHAKVKILHVYQRMSFPSHIPFADSLTEHPEEGLLNKGRKKMLDLCSQIDQKIANNEWESVNYSYAIREGQVEEEIDNFVLEYKPCLLVLGSKGQDNVQTSVLGSVTADIIEIINIPVLAVSELSGINSIKDIKHIAFFTNLQKRDLNAFNLLVDTMKSYTNLKLTLVHINRINLKGDKWPEEELQRMSEEIKKMYSQFNVSYKLIDSPNLFEAIADYVEKDDVNILCINTRRRNVFGRIFAPSVSRKVLVTLNKALLVLRG